MFGIGGSELVFILFIVLMLFGSEKIPEIARTMGKAIAQIKNATNDIKNEIQNSTGTNNFNNNVLNDFTNNINSEIDSVKTNLLGNSNSLNGVSEHFSTEIEQAKASILNKNQKKSFDIKANNNSQTSETNESAMVNQINDEKIQNEDGPIKRKR